MNDNVPHSDQSERAVLGAVLINPVAYLNVAEFLKSADFFFVKHSYIWQAIGKLENEHTAVDVVTVSAELQDMGVLKDIGGPAFLTALIRDVPTSVHAEVYGHLVERTSLRRKLLQVGDEIQALAKDNNLSIEKVFERAEASLLNATGYGIEKSPTDVFTISNDMLTNIEHLAELRKKGISPGLPTGFIDWDNITGGSYKKEILVIAGPAKSGKSTLSLNVARNRLKAGARGVIFITEMTKQALARKFAAMEAGLSAKSIKDVDMSPQQYSRFVEATRKISEWKLDVVDDYPRLSPLDIRRELRRITHKHVVDFVVIDGLWQMRASEGKFDKKTYEVGDILAELREIKDQFNLPLDVVHQCNRGASGRSDKRPVNTDLADSASIERDANTLIFLYRESFYNPNGSDQLEVIVSANREGNTGTARLQFEKRNETYQNYDCLVPVVLAPPAPDQPPLIKDDRKDIYQ